MRVDLAVRANELSLHHGSRTCFFGSVMRKPRPTCPHDEHHHDDDELPGPQLGLADLLHRHIIWSRDTEKTRFRVDPARTFAVPEGRRDAAATLSLCERKIRNDCKKNF